MDYNTAKEIYDKAKLIKDIDKMRFDCAEISNLLYQAYPDVQKMVDKINSVNHDHPENVTIYNLLYKSQGQQNSNAPITVQSLRNDLNWKLIYLTAKIRAKAFDELLNDMSKFIAQQQSANNVKGVQKNG